MQWKDLYSNNLQRNNTDFPENFLLYYFYNKKFQTLFHNKKSILDLGSGFGRNISLYKSFFSDITCIDPVRDSVEFIKEKYKIEAYIFTPPLINIKKKFDVIVACNSIYYMTNELFMDQYLENILKLLNPRGLFIFSLIGDRHTILDGGKRLSDDYYVINSSHERYLKLKNQVIFLPKNEINFSDINLNVISSGEILETFDSHTRELKVYLTQLL